MSNEHDTPNRAEPTSQPGPDVLAERTLTGIFVHLLGLLTSFVGPLVVYAVSDHPFTRRNARNAMNWQLLYAGTLAVTLLAAGLLFVADAVLPDPIVLVAFLAVFAVISATTVVGLLNVALPLFATGKAVFGDAWEYPLAPDVLALERSRADVEFAWWKLLSVFVLTAPALFAGVASSAIGRSPDDVLPAGAFFAVVAVVLVAALFSLPVLYRDAAAVARTDAGWTPNWLTYVGIPFGGGIATYLVAAYYFGSANPTGDAVYGFLAVFWLSTVVYLYRRLTHRHASTDG